MNAAVKLVAVVFVATPLVGFAQDEVKLSCIKDIVFSQEFLANYPKAGAACREVVMRDGAKWARFDANVDNNDLTCLQFGERLPEHTFEFIGTRHGS